MVGWSGRRKTLTILALYCSHAPRHRRSLASIPFIYNVFISLTNRGKFHPNPDCQQTIWRIVEPTCWLGNERRGVGRALYLPRSLYKNYVDLLGGLFTERRSWPWLRIVIACCPCWWPGT